MHQLGLTLEYKIQNEAASVLTKYSRYAFKLRYLTPKDVGFDLTAMLLYRRKSTFPSHVWNGHSSLIQCTTNGNVIP